MSKSQCRIKQQDNCSSSKANPTTKDPNTCVEEELSNNEFQKTIIVKMTNGLREEIQKLLFDLNNNMYQ
jgi:hypothetical protein